MSTEPMPPVVRLPLQFSVAPLIAALNTLDESCWSPHFNTEYYSGDWSGVPLRAVGGRADRLVVDPADTSPVADTPVLIRCPAFRTVLDRLDCETTSVRLLRLGTGARVRDHSDHRLGYEDGEVRLHVPVTTGPGAQFFLDDQLVPMQAGECWYINVNHPHRVLNDDPAPRVHLVADCIVNAWLDNMLRMAVLEGPSVG
jgi:hypothetical protein